jgi:hypothetical protein
VEETAYNDALPLLAFTLEKLYERCKAQGRLTIEAYEELGGVSTVIKHAANAILRDEKYAGLSAEDSRMRDLRRAFYSLAQVGEEGQFTRRTARWSQMPASCEDVLQRFVKDRLLVSGKNGNDQPIPLSAIIWLSKWIPGHFKLSNGTFGVHCQQSTLFDDLCVFYQDPYRRPSRPKQVRSTQDKPGARDPQVPGTTECLARRHP